MSDTRSDFFASGAGEETPASNEDARSAFFASGVPESASHFSKAAEPENTWWNAVKAVGDEGISLANKAVVGTGAAAARTVNRVLPEWIGGEGSRAKTEADINALEQRITYQPQSAAGQQLNENIGSVARPVGALVNDAAGAVVGPENVPATADALATIGLPGSRAILGAPLRAASGVLKYGKEVSAPAEAANAVSKAYGDQSMGAAAAAPDVSKLSPQVQGEIANINRAGGQVHTTALERHAEAESLPVPVPLTRGMARGDSAIMSDEFNSKGKNPEVGQRYDYINQTLKDNLDEFRRESAPGSVGNDPVQNSQSLIDHLKTYDEGKSAAIDKAYSDARAAYKKESGGRDLQMDGNGFVKQAQLNLKEGNKGKFLPPAVQSVLSEVSEGGGKLSFPDWDANRTILANEVRKAQRAGDGNAVAAIGAVRDALESASPLGASATVKPLFDQARGLAKARFDEMKADPAYRAAAEDETPAGEQSDLNKDFSQKYIIGGTRSNLQRLRQKFEGNDEANQTITAVALNHLKQKAGIDMYTGSGNFSQAGYNKALAEIEPRSKELLGNDLAEKTRTLGNVARYTQEQTRGGFSNNSHTLVGALAKSAGAEVGSYAEHAVNTVTPGFKLGSKGAEALGAHRNAQWVRDTLKPGAGLAK